jgi:hypothetical protein
VAAAAQTVGDDTGGYPMTLKAAARPAFDHGRDATLPAM